MCLNSLERWQCAREEDWRFAFIRHGPAEVEFGLDEARIWDMRGDDQPGEKDALQGVELE